LTILQINGDGSLSPFSTFDAPLEYTFQNLELQGNYLFTNFGTFLITGGVLSQLPENLNWFPSSPFAITASTQGPFLYTGSIPTSNPPGLIYPLLVSEGVVTNIEPPLILRGRANQFVIANTSVASTPAPAFVFEPSTLNFNPVNVGSSIVGLLLIYSTGSLPLEINNISISGSPVFSETNDCPSTLAPGQVCRVNVTFAPTSATSFVGSLNMTGNLDGSVPLTGAGIAPPTLTVTPPTQTIQAGQSATFQISVTGVSQTLTVSSCPIPNGTCSISGMTLMVMTTAPMTTAGLTNFTLPPTMVVTIALCVLGVCFVGNIRRWVFTTFK